MPSRESAVLSPDVLLLSILVVSNILLMEGYAFQKSFYIGLLLAYVLLDLLSNAFVNKAFFEMSVQDFFRRQKHVVLLLLIFLMVLWPTLSQVQARHDKGPEFFAHDGMIQTEEAVKMLLAGKNPYTEDYFGTPLERWDYWNREEYGINPVMYHYVYLPFLPLFAVPFYMTSNAVFGWFDLRFIFVLLFLLVMALLEKLANDESRRLQLLMVFALNPWFSDFFDEGRNDIFILAWLVLCVYALKKKKMSLSAVFLGLACASKHTAWFLLPFYLAYVAGGRLTVRSAIQAARKAYPLFVVSAVIVVPFLLWDYHSFVDDVFSSQLSGSSAISYPAGGYGLSSLMIWLGFIRPADYFPFWIPELLVGLPVLYLLLRRQAACNTLGMMFANSGILAFVIAFLSRSFNDNYLGYITCLLALGCFLDDD